MTVDDTWTSLLVRHPPALAAVAGGVGAFLGAGVPGVSLARVGAASLAAESGVRWGTITCGSATFVGALVVLAALRLTGAPAATYVRAAWRTASIAALGPVVIVLGAALGAAAGGGGSAEAHLTAAIAAAPGTWPVAVASALLAVALGLAQGSRA